MKQHHHHETCPVHGDHHCYHCCCGATHECCGHEHGHSHEDSGYHDFAHKLIQMADEAWMDVLHEKIKDHIRNTHGNNLEELAKYASESNSERWKHKLAMERAGSDLKDKMCQFFGSKT